MGLNIRPLTTQIKKFQKRPYGIEQSARDQTVTFASFFLNKFKVHSFIQSEGQCFNMYRHTGKIMALYNSVVNIWNSVGAVAYYKAR
jgi:hypothetical protein